MKAVGLHEFGGPEVLRVVPHQVPQAGPGQVRIRVRAAAVNPGDTLMRMGDIDLTESKPPYVPGMDAAGVIDQIGPRTVTDLRIGDAVMTVTNPTAPQGGAYAEYVVVPAAWAERAPEGSSHAEAATLPMNGLSATHALDLLGLTAGQTLAVTGAAGTLGGYVVQLAKAEGLRIVADAAPADEELVRSLGADVVVARGADFAVRVREAVPDGVDALVDAALVGVPAVDAIRDDGAIAVVRSDDERGAAPLGELGRGITRHMVFVPEYFGRPGALDRLRRLVENGALTLRVAAVHAPEEAAAAHRRLEAGGVRGRLVIEF
ncbi:NADP-dependent oxidoreductase [Streptomyces galilaeus]